MHSYRLVSALLMATCVLSACQAGLLQNSLSDQAAAATNNAANNSGGGNLSGAANGNIAPFESLVSIEAAQKVKRLLMQQALNDKEATAINAPVPDLGALVDGWLASPAYQETMLKFFANAFQQSQLPGSSGDETVQNMRESFARTVLQLNAEGRPFTEAITTRRFMLTTRLMSDYAERETTWYDDNRRKKNQWAIDDPNWKFIVRKAKGAVDLSDASNPNSPNYMVFYAPRLGVSAYYTYNNPKTANDNDIIRLCSTVDPAVFDKNSTYGGSSNGAQLLNQWMMGGEIQFQIQDANNQKITCNTRDTADAAFVAGDYNDWRMVTISQASATSPQTKFTDLTAFRQGKSTMALYMPHVGYLATPSFLDQWPTNASNSSRSTVNQALIVGLNGAVGDDKLVDLPMQPAVDAKHSADAACYNCHKDLDPLRQFYRQSVSLNNGRQLDTKVTSVPAMFAFDGVVTAGAGLQDFAKIITEHPNFARAWVQKLCTWANGGPCLDSDPELARIAAKFASSNFKWDAMVKELMTSPLVTYTVATATSTTLGQSASLARMDQICGLFKQTLGLGELCGRDAVQMGSGYNIPALAATLPGDQYGRGVVAPLYVTRPDLIFRSTLENMCTLVAAKVSAAQSSLPLASSDPTIAVAALVHDFMGIDTSQASEPTAILTEHYNEVLASGQPKDVAWRSTFTLACVSPFVAGIGQ